MKRSIRTYISLLLKLVVAFFALYGVFLSMNAGADKFMGGIKMLMYFSIQSNIVIAIICLIGIYYIFSKNKTPNLWQIIKFVGTLSITLTGAVFCFVLAPTMGFAAWNTVNIYTHVIVPIAAVLDFFVTGIDFNIKKKNVVYTIIPPILYLIYASIGYVQNWDFGSGINYPYFFLNWGSKTHAFGFTNELPFMGVVWWMLLLFILIILVGIIYLYILDVIKKRIK